MIHTVTILKHDDDIYAAFPEVFDRKGNLTSYAHIGQHSAVSLDYIKESEPTISQESEALLRELKGIYETDGDTLIQVTKKCFLMLVPNKENAHD